MRKLHTIAKAYGVPNPFWCADAYVYKKSQFSNRLLPFPRKKKPKKPNVWDGKYQQQQQQHHQTEIIVVSPNALWHSYHQEIEEAVKNLIYDLFICQCGCNIFSHLSRAKSDLEVKQMCTCMADGNDMQMNAWWLMYVCAYDRVKQEENERERKRAYVTCEIRANNDVRWWNQMLLLHPNNYQNEFFE